MTDVCVVGCTSIKSRGSHAQGLSYYTKVFPTAAAVLDPKLRVPLSADCDYFLKKQTLKYKLLSYNLDLYIN